jgi:hypothetical protein
MSIEIPKLFKDGNHFCIWIETTAIQQEWTRLETLTWFCEETGAEYDEVATLLSATLKEKIYQDAIKNYSMPRRTSVTIDDI